MKALARVLSMLVALAAPGVAFAQDGYEPGPDSKRKEGVPEGRIEGPFIWKSQVFPGTIREYSLYIPAQYDPETPACVMVFQDGHAYLNPTGEYRVPIVFDNLIQARQMPVTIGVFVNPGHRGDTFPENRWRANNRSVEYDTLSDAYARLIIDEILPEVAKTYNLAADPERRAICRASSGGIAAFTVAWQRPDAFRKVVSHIGSFTNIRGGDVYPGIIRKAPKKPIRVFLQDGSGDLDNQHGNWPLANQQMALALKFKGYDYEFVYGTGGHTGKHGGAILPDTLRWVWRDVDQPPTAPPAADSAPN